MEAPGVCRRWGGWKILLIVAAVLLCLAVLGVALLHTLGLLGPGTEIARAAKKAFLEDSFTLRITAGEALDGTLRKEEDRWQLDFSGNGGTYSLQDGVLLEAFDGEQYAYQVSALVEEAERTGKTLLPAMLAVVRQCNRKSWLRENLGYTCTKGDGRSVHSFYPDGALLQQLLGERIAQALEAEKAQIRITIREGVLETLEITAGKLRIWAEVSGVGQTQVEEVSPEQAYAVAGPVDSLADLMGPAVPLAMAAWETGKQGSFTTRLEMSLWELSRAVDTAWNIDFEAMELTALTQQEVLGSEVLYARYKGKELLWTQALNTGIAWDKSEQTLLFLAALAAPDWEDLRPWFSRGWAEKHLRYTVEDRVHSWNMNAYEVLHTLVAQMAENAPGFSLFEGTLELLTRLEGTLRDMEARVAMTVTDGCLTDCEIAPSQGDSFRIRVGFRSIGTTVIDTQRLEEILSRCIGG